MPIPLFLKIKVIVTEFMAHDFPKNVQTYFLINLGLKIAHLSFADENSIGLGV